MEQNETGIVIALSAAVSAWAAVGKSILSVLLQEVQGFCQFLAEVTSKVKYNMLIKKSN